MSKIFERNPDTGQIRSRDVGDCGNETIVKEGNNKTKEIPNWLVKLVKKEPNNMELGGIIRTIVDQKDQWLIDQYNRNRSIEDHISDVADMPNLQNNIYTLENKEFAPKGKPAPDGDYWFSKDDRKQRG